MDIFEIKVEEKDQKRLSFYQQKMLIKADKKLIKMLINADKNADKSADKTFTFNQTDDTNS